MEKRPKPRVRRLLAALIARCFTDGVDSVLLGLLGVPDGIVITTFLGSMPLIELMLILLFIAGVRGVVTQAGRRRPTGHGCLAGSTPLGGPDHILSLLDLLFPVRVHPKIKDMKERSITRYGQKITRSEEINNFWK
jgi:hypothetical protein